MNRLKTIVILFGVAVLGCAAQTWDIYNKSMSDYDEDDNSSTGKAWQFYVHNNAKSAIEQNATYVSFKKTEVANGSCYAWLRSSAGFADPLPGQAYSVEVKVRVQPVDVADKDSYVEANQISLRFAKKSAPIYLRYGDGQTGGSVNVKASVTDTYPLNTGEWQVYRMVIYPDHAHYDVWVEGVDKPLFENVAVVSTVDRNSVYFGAESKHRCNISVEYVRMGTGDFFSKAKIASLNLSSSRQLKETENTVNASVATAGIADGEKLYISLVDKDDKEVVKAIEATVASDKAEATLTIPATVASGTYRVKVAAPGDKIGDVNVWPQTADYWVNAFDFSSKNLVAFGNSITAAKESWAYHMESNLGFADLYNGAFAGACWYKRARLAQDGDSIWTQDYTDPKFAGMSNGSNSNREAFQKIINNCAVVHVQKYLKERDKNKYPDYIIMSYGTNDSYGEGTMGNADATLKADFSKLDLFTMAGALRWCIDTLRMEFPKTKIYVALPIQAKKEDKNKQNTTKIGVITKVCDGLSVPYFDCYNESGITQANADQYLRDGLHPNAAGQVLHGAYLSRKLDEAEASNQPGTRVESVTETAVAVSATMLHAGQALTVRSLDAGTFLSNVSLYDIAGNELSRTDMSSIEEYSLSAPMTAGAYVLTVRLADNSVKSFKVLVTN